MGECPAHYEKCHAWAGGSGFYKKTGWASHDEQASKQQASVASASAPVSGFLAVWVPVLTSFHDEQCVNQINPFLSKLLWAWCFIKAIETLTKTSLMAKSKIQVRGWLPVSLIHFLAFWVLFFSVLPKSVLTAETLEIQHMDSSPSPRSVLVQLTA